MKVRRANQLSACGVLLALAGGALAQSDRVAGLSPVTQDAAPPPVAATAPAPIAAPLDLSPYFSDPQLAAAKALFDQGHYRKARALLVEAPDSNPVRYLRALSGLYGGAYPEAAGEFSALANDYPAMSDRCLFFAGQALERGGRPQEAAALWGEVHPGSRLFRKARYRMSQALRRTKDLRGAMDALALLLEQPDPQPEQGRKATTLMDIAGLAHQLKDADAEREALLKLWATAPQSPLAKEALRRLGSTRIPLEAKVTRAETLIDLHHNRWGISLLQPMLKGKLQAGDELGCRIWFAYGKALRKERQHARAVAALKEVTARCDDESLRPGALHLLAYSQSIVNGPEAAIRTYETLSRDYPAHPTTDDAMFLAAELELVRKRDLDEALRRHHAVAVHYPRGNHAAEALFKAFWINRKRGNLEAGLEVLAGTEKLTRVAREQLARAAYWRARTMLDLGAREEALDRLEKVAVDSSASYYGMLARKRLAELDRPRAERVIRSLVLPVSDDESELAEAEEPKPPELEPQFQTGVELLRMGLPDAVSEFLAVDRTTLPPESISRLVRVLYGARQIGAANVVTRALQREATSGQPMSAELKPAWKISYPNRFGALVERYSRSARVDPDLLRALIREESGFNPRARSSTGALGLTQLMPATASQVASWISQPPPGSLVDPSRNIRLGSLYFGSLLRGFKNNPAFAVASYNAGPDRVRSWLKAQPRAETDEWVEDIPIDETRGYVKRVLGSYDTYQLLYRRDVKKVKVKAAAAKASAPAATVEPREAAGVAVADPPTPSEAAVQTEAVGSP